MVDSLDRILRTFQSLMRAFRTKSNSQRNSELRSSNGQMARVTCVGMVSLSGLHSRTISGDPDGYRFHDVFHLAHAAILHWSPTFRALIRQKRKSDAKLDENEDGGRAIVIEEGLTAYIFSCAKELEFFEGQSSVSFDLLKTINKFVRGYEVEQCPLWLWEKAILDGYQVFRQIVANNGGTVIGDRNTRTISYESNQE